MIITFQLKNVNIFMCFFFVFLFVFLFTSLSQNESHCTAHQNKTVMLIISPLFLFLNDSMTGVQVSNLQ